MVGADAARCVYFCLAAIACGMALFGHSTIAQEAQNDDEIQRQIEVKNEEIRRLEAEAEKHRAVIASLSREAQSLQREIGSIEAQIQRLTASIGATNAKISRATLEIKMLARSIAATEADIERGRTHIKTLVAELAARDRESPLAAFIKNDTISTFFAALDHLGRIQGSIQAIVTELRAQREMLAAQKSTTEGKRAELTNLAADLADQKSLQDQARRDRNQLLAETKNQEKQYQNLLHEIERKRAALQQEINALEAGLSADFDRSRLPARGSGVLGWPLPAPILITQYFGNTDFARSGGYNGSGHNGIDVRAVQGTPIFASESGVVRATGDTDVVCPRASYGRWILIDHANNLSTLYAHLSLIRVTPRQSIARGELIGYSGRTGYATGPHLHFSVFAREAVVVGELKSRTCSGRTMTLPISPFGGYLDPMEYL